MTTTRPTVEELNAIQADWMALESNAPEMVKKRVFALMETLPRNYLAVSPDLSRAGVMMEGTPMFAEKIPIAEAVAYLQSHVNQWNAHKTRFDVAWCGHTGQWVKLPEITFP